MRHDFSKPPYYWACGRQREGRVCNKKASRVSNSAGAGDEFWCEACNAAAEARPRFVLSFSLGDHSGSIYANCFDEVGEHLLGLPASELAKLCEGPLADEAAFVSAFLAASFQQQLFKIRAKMETYLVWLKLKH